MSVMREPFARRMKKGSPPTFLKARTGEFTPPGMYCLAVAKSLLERVAMGGTFDAGFSSFNSQGVGGSGWGARIGLFSGGGKVLPVGEIFSPMTKQEVIKKPSQENPLINILINVLIPVLALSFLSKDPVVQEMLGKEVRPWHVGPLWALAVGLAFPICYGVWFFAKTRKMNFFSGLGLFSVLLTGGLTLFLWNKDGTVKEHAAVLFGLKEASIPFVLGVAIIASHWSKTPLLRTFLYTDSIFDIDKIEKKVGELGREADYAKVLLNATVLFSFSFFVSTLLNFGLAMYFLGDLDHAAADAMTHYNERVAKITGWGFVVIGVPIMVFLFFTLKKLFAGLRGITGLRDEELTMPR